MYSGKLVFAQLMAYLPRKVFRRCVARYRGEYKVQQFSCWDQYCCMAFAQLTGRESLRDIEACLRAQQAKLYHMGIRGRVSRSTLADANANRDWHMYADFAHILIHRARALYQEEDFGVDLDETVYALDSTTIDLCLSVFPWAQFRQTKSAVKLHTLLDLRGPIPTSAWITPGTGGAVSHGPGLPRLSPLACVASGPCLVHYSREIESPVSAAVFAADRQGHWAAL